MVFQRIFAGFLVFLFIAVSTAAFLVFAVSNTFLRPSFYEEDLQEAGYEFLVNTTVKSIEEADGPISKYFVREELREQVETVFPPSLYDRTVKEIIQEVSSLRDDPERPLTFRLSTYRESLLTLAHNLAFEMFETLPSCGEGEAPGETSEGLPSCVPPDLSYGDVSARLSQQFEQDIYAAVPEQGQFDVRSAFGEAGFGVISFMVQLDTIKVVFYGILLVLLALIALVVYCPFTAILMAEGVAFLVSGIVGLGAGFGLSLMPYASHKFNGADAGADFVTLFSAVMESFSAEIYKSALVFLATGIILLSVRYFLVKR